jgi:hypothetical protein
VAVMLSMRAGKNCARGSVCILFQPLVAIILISHKITVFLNDVSLGLWEFKSSSSDFQLESPK